MMDTTNEREFANDLGYLGGAGPEVRLHVHNLCDKVDALQAELAALRAPAQMALEALDDVVERLEFLSQPRGPEAPSVLARAKAAALRAALQGEKA